MISGQNIVFFGDDWGRHVSSSQHLIRRFASHNRVLWVNTFGMRPPSLSLSDLRRSVQKIAGWISPAVAQPNLPKNMTLISIFGLPYYSVPAIRRMNAQLSRTTVLNAIYNQKLTDPIVITSLPTTVDLVGKLGERAFIYYCVDEFTHYPGLPSRIITEMEKELLSKADLVIVTSSELQKRKQGNQREVRLIPHGVDVDHFAQALELRNTVPAPMVGIRRPIIGFLGLLSDWVDLSLLVRMAQLTKHWSWVFVGATACNTADLKRLRALPNVFILGKVDYKHIPEYVACFDVGVIPFEVSELTVNVNPLKLLEYFACGLPVVSTPLPEVMRYQDLVFIADTPEAFVQAIECAMAKNSAELQQQRMLLAASASWESRAEDFARLVEERLQEKAYA